MSLPHLLLALTALSACASAPPRPAPVPSGPPAPLARPARVAPPEGSLERRFFDTDSEVVVLPIAVPANAASGDEDRALGLSALLLHTLDGIPDLLPGGLALDDTGRPLPLEALAGRDARYVVGGRLLRAGTDKSSFELELWLMDREAKIVATKTARPDLPRLLSPRNALADLLAEVGRGPSELERADMTWYEDLDLAQLALAGELVRMGHRVGREALPEDVDALFRRGDAEAPWSFVVAVAVAEHFLPREGSCNAATVARLSHMLSLNREMPYTLEVYALTCVLASELSEDMPDEGPALPAWSKRSGSHCRIGAKGLTSVASTRGPIATGPDPKSFVTGLGGLYRGETCDAGYAVMQHSPDKLGPPFVRASLELEAGFYFYGHRNLEKATRWFERAIATTANAIGPEAHCLVDLLGAEAQLGLADLAIEDGRQAEARAILPKVRATAERCNDARMVGRTLNSEALLEQSLSHFDRALSLLDEANREFSKIGDTTNLAVVETNVGATLLYLGGVDKAIPHLEVALAGKRLVRSQGGIGVLLENLGVAELARGDREAAAQYFAEALKYTNDPHTEATLQVQLARIALAKGDAQGAGEHMDLARASSVAAHSRVLEAIIEQTDAAVEVEQGQFKEALADFHDALAIRRQIGDRAGEGVTLTLLMQLSERMKEPSVAILYGKLAIAAHQQVRQSAGAVDMQTKKEFTETRSDAYRQLADLLVSEGRLIEAERVLALLKEDEASQWTRDAVAPTSDGIPLTRAEKKLDKRYNDIAGEVMRLGTDYAELTAKWPRSAPEEASLETLRKQIEAANQAFSDFLANIAREGENLGGSKQLEDLKEGTSMGPDLADLGKGYVAVYTLVSKKKTNLIVVSPDAQVARVVDVNEAALNAVIASFRQALQDPARDPRIAGKELYDLILAPIEKDLVAANAKTILWSLDRTLRYVPLAALYDGKHYALERWGMSVFTPASKARMKDTPQAAWRVLALGVTEAHPPFPALPAVADELGGLVDLPDTPASEGVLPGMKALDGDFTKELLFQQLSRKWPVVHLASHFSFTPGDRDESYLLLGDGTRLTVGELERAPNLFQGVDLLTLSACNTATSDVGDGAEVESFAVLAQRKGARAVFASLWPVADQSTSALMRRFYQLHGSMPTKLEALRKAQLEFIQAKATPPPGTTRAKPLLMPGSAPTEPPPSGPVDPALAGWRHPYYWAPFILVGNVL